MAKAKASWSKPDGIPDLIGQKQVDPTIFKKGTTIPREFHEEFYLANGGEELAPGEQRNIRLVIEGQVFEARLSLDDRTDSAQGWLQIQYGSNKKLKEFLQKRLQDTYQQLQEAYEAKAKAKGDARKHFVKTTDMTAAYLDFYRTGMPYQYRVEIRTAQSASWVPPDFKTVWSNLQHLIGAGRTVYTLSKKARNDLRWQGDAIAVTTDRSTDPLPRSMFEEAWNALAEQGIVFADRFPGTSRYRNAAVSAILAMLPYVDYTLNPRIRLFLTGHIFTPKELTQVVGDQGNSTVRWAGQPHSPKNLAVVTSSSHAESFTLQTTQIEAGQALAAQRKAAKTAYAFTEAEGGYRYLGRYQIEAVREEGASYIATLTPEQEPQPQPDEPIITPILDLTAITQQFSAALQASHIYLSDERVRAFIAALATKRLVILTGLSGSGKTQIALRFGQWLGDQHHKIIPVRPDWTGSEALFGYEDAIGKATEDGRRPWHAPEALRFMLDAARNPGHPYLLVLDEMNLAHVERYFADVLSGMESGQPCLPNLHEEDDGRWRLIPGEERQIPVPPNLFIVGTVNVDETTYMFSPKVLDRANTFEFRVETDDLTTAGRKPQDCAPGAPEYVTGFLAIAADDDWQIAHPAAGIDTFTAHLRTVHRLLSEGGFEFGHRVFYEAIRFAAMLAAAGSADPLHALDLQLMQKVLPRLHGTRRRLEPTLLALARFCGDLTHDPGAPPADRPDPAEPQLPRSLEKLRRMLRSLRANQFTSFTE